MIMEKVAQFQSENQKKTYDAHGNLEVNYTNDFVMLGMESPASMIDTNRMQENIPSFKHHTV
jgi:hypothetical protein